MNNQAEAVGFISQEELIEKPNQLILFPFFVWLIACVFYTIQYFLRVSIAGLSHTISRSIHQDATALSLVAAAYYFTYMILQVPSGSLIDRLGCRKMLVFSTITTAVGALAFAHAHNYSSLILARMLMGAGGAFSILITMKLIRQWFDTKFFPILSSITMAFGILGGCFGAGPFHTLIPKLTWQTLMYYSGVFCLLLGVFSYFLLKFSPSSSDAQTTSTHSNFRTQLQQVIKMPVIWYAGLTTGLLYLPITAFASLWCSPFLKALFPSASPLQIGFANSLIFFGYAIGSIVLSAVSAKTNKPFSLLRGSAAIVVVLLSLLIKLPFTSLNTVAVILTAIGFFSGALVIVWDLVRKATVLSISATAFGLLNFLQILAGALILPFMGFELDRHWQHHFSNFGEKIFTLATYHYAFAILIFSAVMAWLLTFKLNKYYQNRIMPAGSS